MLPFLLLTAGHGKMLGLATFSTGPVAGPKQQIKERHSSPLQVQRLQTIPGELLTKSAWSGEIF